VAHGAVGEAAVAQVGGGCVEDGMLVGVPRRSCGYIMRLDEAGLRRRRTQIAKECHRGEYKAVGQGRS
jgi:hypothetical protein